MATPQKAFQAQIFAKNHYRKLLTAKSSVRQLKERGSNSIQSVSKTVTPLDRYQYQATNTKICNKLSQIYKCTQTSFRKYRRSKQKYSRSLNEQNIKEQKKGITKQNIEIFERILHARSIVSQDWKQRQKTLKKYNKLARKKIPQNDQILFEAYRKLMTHSRLKSGRSYRHKSTKNNSSSSSKNSNKARFDIQQTI